jgi:hypothetical protein
MDGRVFTALDVALYLLCVWYPMQIDLDNEFKDIPYNNTRHKEPLFFVSCSQIALPTRNIHETIPRLYRSILLNPSIHRSIHPSIHPSIDPSIHRSIHPSIHPSIVHQPTTTIQPGTERKCSQLPPTPKPKNWYVPSSPLLLNPNLHTNKTNRKHPSTKPSPAPPAPQHQPQPQP